jgi:hypothetical protein
MNSSSGLGWKIALVVVSVLLMASLVTLTVVVVLASGDRSKSKAGIAELNKKVTDLQVTADNRMAARSARASAPAAAKASSESASASQPRQSSDADVIYDLAGDHAGAGATVNRNSIQIEGDWARIGVTPTQTGQGYGILFHEVNGSWTYVTEGSSIPAEDAPGCPASLLE